VSRGIQEALDDLSTRLDEARKHLRRYEANDLRAPGPSTILKGLFTQVANALTVIRYEAAALEAEKGRAGEVSPPPLLLSSEEAARGSSEAHPLRQLAQAATKKKAKPAETVPLPFGRPVVFHDHERKLKITIENLLTE
jgi:hypothetical protein